MAPSVVCGELGELQTRDHVVIGGRAAARHAAKDCLGGEKIVDVDFGRPLAMTHLDEVSSAFADVHRTILEELPRPFFRLDVHGRFLLTGILGDASARFTVRRHLDETRARSRSARPARC